MRTTPRVTVVMPVFNALPYLTEAVESILEQTFSDWELVAVDDASRDGSGDALTRFAEADNRIRLLVNDTNLGVSHSLNRGWRAARGAYVAVANADDASLPDRFERQVKFLDANPSVAVVGGAMIIVNHEGSPIATQRFPTGARVIRSILRRYDCISGPSVMIRRSTLESTGGYRFRSVEDYDLWLRIAERFDLGNLRDPLIRYRFHAEQITSRSRVDMVRRTIAVRRASEARRSLRPDPLAGVDDLTPAVMDGLRISDTELSREIASESILWAALLASLGRDEEAQEFVQEASRTIGPRAIRAFRASVELNRAQRLKEGGRLYACFWAVGCAVAYEPRYALTRLGHWLLDACRSACYSRWWP